MAGATNADMVEFWNGDTGQKWVRFQDMMDASLLPLGHRAMAAAAVRAGERVIDVGCGCGDTTLDLARRVGSDGAVLGVDISAPMLARAKARATAESNVTFAAGDAQVHAFGPATYDLVYSRFGVMFFDDPVAAFRNLRSALKPRGRVAFASWRPAKENEWVKIPTGIVGAHVPLPPPSGPEEPGEFGFADAERMRRILTGASYTGVTIEKFDTPITIAGGAGVEAAADFLLEMGPTGRAIASAGADHSVKARIGAALRDGLRPYETKAGVVMGAATWIVTAQAPA